MANSNPSPETRFPNQIGGHGRRKDDPRAEFWRQFRDAIVEIEIALKDAKGKSLKRLPCVEALTRKLVKWAMEEVKVKGEETGSPQNPQMVKLFFDKCLGNEVVLSGELGEGLHFIFECRDGKDKDAN